MLDNGLQKEQILKILEEKLELDYAYDEGNILGSMCTQPHDFGYEIFFKYAHKNLGDPGLFKGTSNLEKELIADIGELFGGKNIIGTFTSGGSEANIIAMRIARNLRSDIKKPEFIIPGTAHASFHKGEDFLGIKLHKIRLKENYDLDIDHFKSLINMNTCGVLGIAGTTSLGLIDPIEEMAELIEGRNIFFHVDAAFGGFVLPFLTELGYKVPKWDFNIDAVSSITADPHKMGMGFIPTGGLFLREPSILEKAGFSIPYLAGGDFKHFQIIGTRPGGTVIAFWALMKLLGKNGFKEVVRDCMDSTNHLVNLISDVKGIKLAADPIMNVIGLTTENGESICEIDLELRKKNGCWGNF